MAKKERKKTRRDYEARRKRIISIVCIALAAMFLIWTVAGTMLFSFANEGSSPDQPAPAPQQSEISSELRGIWVCTVSNIDYPTVPSVSPEALKAEADTVIHDCYELGMNAIFLQVRPASDAIYKSAYFPWSRYLTGQQGTAPEDDFDPLAYWVEKAHERGIELHAWINPFRVAQSSSEWKRLSEDNPALGAYNDYVIQCGGGYYFDPGQPAVRGLIIDGVKEIVENYNVDGIHFDDYFYPDQTSSAGSVFHDQDAYQAYGNGMDLAEWRRENINQLIRKVYETVHAADSHCVFGVSPMGVWANYGTSSLGSATRGGESYSMRFADSYTWVKNHWIDYIAPQIYWSIGYSAADYKILAEWWSDVVRGTDVKLYIGMADNRANAVSGVWQGTSELLRQLRLNDTLPEVGGEIHFRYRAVAGSTDLYEFYRNVYASDRVPAFTDPVGVEPDSGLYDIIGHWAENHILSLVGAGVINGMGDGTFRPNAPVTRAQFVKMLAAVEGVSDSTVLPEETLFEDVLPEAWFSFPVRWAASKGIVSGRSAVEFAPDDNITREEMAKMVSGFCSLSIPVETGLQDQEIEQEKDQDQETEKNQEVESEESADESAADTESSEILFADAPDISTWAEDAVRNVVRLGIMNGVQEADSAFFYPYRNTTRAEAAKVVNELRERKLQADVQPAPGVPDEAADPSDPEGGLQS